MDSIRKLVSRVEAIIKRLDPEAIVQGTFFDEASRRLFLTVVKGSRKVGITLLPQNFDEANLGRTEKIIEESIDRLQTMPIG